MESNGTMMDMQASANLLLGRLSDAARARLAPHLTRVHLEQGTQLETVGDPVRTVYFPEDALVSVIASLPRSRDIEVGVIGRDGISAPGVALGDRQSSYLVIIQIAGMAQRLETGILFEALADTPEIKQMLDRFARAFMVQAASTALANGRSRLEDRLARWILMVQDRIGGDRIPLTHEFLSVMLGVRRAGVTDTLHILEGKNLIRSNRGEIIIRDRDGLVVLADGAYGYPEQEYKRILGVSMVK
jgi:CRP-like cAMP-binding protein